MADRDDESLRRAEAARNDRWAVVLFVTGVLIWVAAWFVLTVERWDAERHCGSALSNPGFHRGTRCYDTVLASGRFGWIAAGAALLLLVFAGQLRWGPGWTRSQYRRVPD